MADGHADMMFFLGGGASYEGVGPAPKTKIYIFWIIRRKVKKKSKLEINYNWLY